jgi:hypothetical protein
LSGCTGTTYEAQHRATADTENKHHSGSAIKTGHFPTHEWPSEATSVGPTDVSEISYGRSDGHAALYCARHRTSSLHEDHDEKCGSAAIGPK